MLVYDCDDTVQFTELEGRAEDGDLLDLNLLQSFAPDSLDEAANRGVRAI